MPLLHISSPRAFAEFMKESLLPEAAPQYTAILLNLLWPRPSAIILVNGCLVLRSLALLAKPMPLANGMTRQRMFSWWLERWGRLFYPACQIITDHDHYSSVLDCITIYNSNDCFWELCLDLTPTIWRMPAVPDAGYVLSMLKVQMHVPSTIVSHERFENLKAQQLMWYIWFTMHSRCTPKLPGSVITTEEDLHWKDLRKRHIIIWHALRKAKLHSAKAWDCGCVYEEILHSTGNSRCLDSLITLRWVPQRAKKEKPNCQPKHYDNEEAQIVSHDRQHQ